MNNCMNISIWSITNMMMKLLLKLLNTCIILLGIGRIYSVQGGGDQKGGGRDMFKIQGGVG